MEHSERGLAVLFIDVSDSTGLYARRGDEVAYRLISSCLELIEEAIRAAGGRPVKRVGDEVLAVADSPEAALRGALLAQEVVTSSQLHEERIRVRAGLSYGPTIVVEGDVHGDNVIIAARLASLANANEILLSESVREMLSAEMREATRPIPPVRLRGRQVESAIFHYVGDLCDEATKRATRATRPWAQTLEVRYGDQSFAIDAMSNLVRIGRAEDNQIVVHDDVVSRYHASVECVDDRYVLADRSFNGTHVHTSTGERLHLVRSQAVIFGEGEIFPGSLRLQPIAFAVRRR